MCARMHTCVTCMQWTYWSSLWYALANLWRALTVQRRKLKKAWKILYLKGVFPAFWGCSVCCWNRGLASIRADLYEIKSCWDSWGLHQCWLHQGLLGKHPSCSCTCSAGTRQRRWTRGRTLQNLAVQTPLLPRELRSMHWSAATYFDILNKPMINAAHVSELSKFRCSFRCNFSCVEVRRALYLSTSEGPARQCWIVKNCESSLVQSLVRSQLYDTNQQLTSLWPGSENLDHPNFRLK